MADSLWVAFPVPDGVPNGYGREIGGDGARFLLADRFHVSPSEVVVRQVKAETKTYQDWRKDGGLESDMMNAGPETLVCRLEYEYDLPSSVGLAT